MILLSLHHVHQWDAEFMLIASVGSLVRLVGSIEIGWGWYYFLLSHAFVRRRTFVLRLGWLSHWCTGASKICVLVLLLVSRRDG